LINRSIEGDRLVIKVSYIETGVRFLMTLFDITLNSLKRQISKKVFMFIAMIITFSTVLILYTYITSQTLNIENQFKQYGANILITSKRDKLSLNNGGFSFNEVISLKEIKKEELQNIYKIPNIDNIRVVSPQLIGIVKVTSGLVTESLFIVGTDFESELKIKGWWNKDIEVPDNNNEVILGYDVAEKMKVFIGDKLLINNKLFNIINILEVSGTQDDDVIFAHLETVEELLNKKDLFSIVEVSTLCSDCSIDDLVTQLLEVLPNSTVRALKDDFDKKLEVINKLKIFSLSISIILIILCSILIFTNMSSSVNERSYEIGIYRAIGFMKSDILEIIQAESIVIGALAGFVGILISLFFIIYIIPNFTHMDSEKIIIDYFFFIKGYFVLILFGFISSLIPAFKASNSDPIHTIINI